jgi:hypothetical protein
MLYLFGRLALSDSLDYSENFHEDDYRPAAPSERAGRPAPEAPASAPEHRLRAARPCPPAGVASPSCASK